MRMTAGGCYEISGVELRRVDNPERAALARWRERQTDLWEESSSIAHEHRRLTVEEARLLHTMWKELETIGAAVARLEGDVPAPPPS